MTGIQTNLGHIGPCLINLNKDVTTIPTDFEIYDVNDEFFIYLNLLKLLLLGLQYYINK